MRAKSRGLSIGIGLRVLCNAANAGFTLGAPVLVASMRDEAEAQAEAEKAIQMFNGKAVGNRELKVNLARPREERPAGGGGRREYGGGGGGRGGDRY